MATLLGVLVALSTGACSISLPVSSLVSEEPEATSGVAVAPSATFTRELGPEDWRRAQDALAKALDLHGNSSLVAWTNPKTAMRGSFAPAGLPFVRRDEICRSFQAIIAGQAAPATLEGTACRPSGGDWAIKNVKSNRKA